MCLDISWFVITGEDGRILLNRTVNALRGICKIRAPRQRNKHRGIVCEKEVDGSSARAERVFHVVARDVLNCDV